VSSCDDFESINGDKYQNLKLCDWKRDERKKRVFDMKAFWLVLTVAFVGVSLVFSGCAETEDASLMTATGALGYDDGCYEGCMTAGTEEEQCRRDCCAEDYSTCYDACFEVVGDDELCRLRCTRSEAESAEESAPQNEDDGLTCMEGCLGEGFSQALCAERCAAAEE
jgi:hypothetical protein